MGQPSRWALALLSAGVALVVALAALLAAPPAQGGARRPAAADALLTRVEARATTQGRRLRSLRADHERAPADLERALRLARAEIEQARETGDPRALDRAEQALSAWLARPSPPADVLVLAAIVRQAQHRFDASLELLERALAAAPDDPQALLTQASILTLRSRYSEALDACARLRGLTSELVRVACGAPIQALTGRARDARAALAAALAASRQPRERAWLESLVGELAYWAQDHAAAERAWTAALALDPDDRHTRGLLADLWLERGRADRVLELLRGVPEDDGTLLRLALAERARDPAYGRQLAARLEARFAKARRRADFAHHREAGRWALSRGDQRAALHHAGAGFAQQQELWDARLLLEAALTARDREAARPALVWLEQHQVEAPLLQGLAAELRRLP